MSEYTDEQVNKGDTVDKKTFEITTKLNKHLERCCEYIYRVFEIDSVDYSLDLTKEDVCFSGLNFNLVINYFELEGRLDIEVEKKLVRRTVPIVD